MAVTTTLVTIRQALRMAWTSMIERLHCKRHANAAQTWNASEYLRPRQRTIAKDERGRLPFGWFHACNVDSEALATQWSWATGTHHPQAARQRMTRAKRSPGRQLRRNSLKSAGEGSGSDLLILALRE